MQLVSYNHVFALLICMQRFNSINFYQNRLKLKSFLPKKDKIYERWGPRLQTHNGHKRLGAPPPDPRNSPLTLQISGYIPAYTDMKDSIGLKLELRNCGKTKLFLIRHLRYLLFELL